MNVKFPIRAGFSALLSGVFVLACPLMAAAQGRNSIDMITQADANGDGAVSWSEVVARRTQNFARLDRDNDGYISTNDRPPGPFGARFDEAFAQVQKQFDANSDRRVSRSEMIDTPGPAFTKGDVDGNGVLSAEELSSLRAAAAGS
jgi:hypothetical protein